MRYKVISTIYEARKALEAITDPIGFDLETRSIYSKEDRALAKTLLSDDKSIQELNPLAVVESSSGLSHPSIIRVTHIIISLSEEFSYIFISDDKLEKFIFDWLVTTDIKIIIHNSSFDLKIVHHRTGKFPKDFEDTQQLAKVLINDCNNYNSRTGLKVLVGSHYPPKWSIKEETDYEVEDLRDKDFLEYCAIDGIAILYLWKELQ